LESSNTYIRVWVVQYVWRQRKRGLIPGRGRRLYTDTHRPGGPLHFLFKCNQGMLPWGQSIWSV